MKERSLFETIYNEHQDKVFGICLGHTNGNVALAKDLTQDVFVKVFDHYGSFRQEAKIATWIYRIAVNTCYQYFRKRKHVIFKVQIPDVEDQVLDDRELKFTQMYKCINRLTDQNRSIILLELEDLPQDEIAEIIGISHQALRTRLHRIKDQIAKCVQNERI